MQPVGVADVKWGEWIGEGWQMFVNQWLGWVLIMLVFLILIMIPLAPVYAFVIAAQLASAGSGDVPVEPPAFFWVFLPVFYLVIILGASFLMAGAYRAAFKQMRGGQVSVSDLFSGGDVFLRVAGGVVLTGLLTAAGAIFCILPGFIAVGLFYFTVPLIIDKNLGVIDAMKASLEVTKARWYMFALFAIVVSLLAQVGSVACGVGMLATFPLYFTINTVAFRDLFGVQGARSFLQQQTPSAGYAQQWSAPPEAPKPTQECPRCGATGLAVGAKFCNLCGANLAG